MKIEKIFLTVAMFSCIYLKSADKDKPSFDMLVPQTDQVFKPIINPYKKKLDTATYVGAIAMLHPTTILAHRMDMQDGINESLQFQDKKNAEDIQRHGEDIKKLFATLRSFTQAFKLQENINEAHDKKYTAFDLCLGELHKDLNKVKQHVGSVEEHFGSVKEHLGMLTESMVGSVQEDSKPFATLNDIADQGQGPTLADLIRRCESLETSNRQIKEELRQHKAEKRKLKKDLAQQKAELTRVWLTIQLPESHSDEESKYELASRCSSPANFIRSPQSEGSPKSSPKLVRVLSENRLSRSAPVSPRSSSPVRSRLSLENLPGSDKDSDEADYADAASSDDEDLSGPRVPLTYNQEFSGATFEDIWQPDNTLPPQAAAVPQLQLPDTQPATSNKKRVFTRSPRQPSESTGR